MLNCPPLQKKEKEKENKKTHYIQNERQTKEF